MPECKPICGLYYDLKKVPPEKVVAPQYDIVSQEEISYYKSLSPYNAFHLELAENPEKAKLLLDEWKKTGVLIKDAKPALYYYELEFKFSEKLLKRRGFILLVKLHSFEDRQILPHERTFSFVKEERLALLKTAQCYFSQIFGLYEDQGLRTLSLPEERDLVFEVCFNEERHRLYRITNRDFIGFLREHLKGRPIYIADGHHRYQIALTYKAYMEKLFKAKESYDFQYAPFYLTPFEEESLFMLPTHRHYLFPLEESVLNGLKEYAEELRRFKLEEVEAFLEGFAEKNSVFFLFYREQGMVFQIKKEVMAEIERDEPILSRLPLFNFLKLFERVFGQTEEELKAKGKVEFFSNFFVEKLQTMKARESFFVLFPRVSPQVLRDAVSSGRLMPHKSTYFYPKILTGTIFYEAKGTSLPRENEPCS